MPDPTATPPAIPESRAVGRKKTPISVVWIIPIVAALAGVWVAVTRILAEGPKITIVFQSAEGLEAGKTKIHYNGVEIGTITTIALSDDHLRVVTTAQMAPRTEDFLAADSRFWVVRPRISGASVSGLSTLISGAYIAVEIGQSKERKREFVALDNPPVISSDVAGRYFVLKAKDLGSLEGGTPLYFRRIKVGEVTEYKLDDDGKAVTVRVFVKAPYDQYVNLNTRFWQASGVDVTLSANGLSVQTQSLLSILVGGIAFETSAAEPISPPADADTVFTLFDDRTEAFKLASRNPQTFVLVFKQSVRGLVAGAPVEFQGIPIGEVISIHAQVDPVTAEFTVPVTISLDAQQLGVRIIGVTDPTELIAARRHMVETLVARGVRAQLRSGNLLTGQLFVAFDFFADAKPATVDWAQTPPQLPTMPGEMEALEASVANIIKKLDKLPYQGIADDLRKALAGFDQTMAGARRTLDNADVALDHAGKLVAPNSALDQELTSALQEVSRAARGIRVLADYLERHPEALIRGKAGEAQ